MSMIGYFFLASDEELRAARSAPETIEDLLNAAYEERSADLVDVDKAWHCLHFLLTGTAWEGEPPLDFIVRGGTEVGEDMGYGAARAFDSAELKAIADALEKIERDVLVHRFDAAEMNRLEIYPPGNWGEVDPRSEETFGYFSGAFDAVKDLARRGRAAGTGLLVWLS
jgi:Domain of unknown function (DUF1877)